MKMGKLITRFFIGLVIVFIVSFYISIKYRQQSIKFIEKVSGLERIEEKKANQAKQDINILIEALESYRKDNGGYPDTEQGLKALIEKPTLSKIPKSWRAEGYLEKGIVPKDPWGNDYIYLSPGFRNKNFDIWSYGADGLPGGKQDILGGI